jgi:16S rRNA (guanine527-N7)-methyltransferase
VSNQALREALASSQRLGMLGARPIEEVIVHATAFTGALVDVEGLVVDLGSGGGVPGLVVATDRPDLTLLLVDRRTSRTDHLARLVRRLGLEDRVTVLCGDALTLALPAPASAVVARGFGSPELTARAAGRLLTAGGILVVSEPPDGPDRWQGAAGFEQLPWADRRVARLRHVPRGTSTP